MSKYLDSNGLLYFWQKLKTVLGGKVDAEAGKGLSANDYTTAEKTKLAGIAEGANAYTHPASAGNKHIPTGGASGQILRWDASGTAVWGADQDTVYTHPSHPAKASGLYKVTVDAQGHVSAAAAATKGDITALGIPAQDTTYAPATGSVAGLMAAADKTKLDGFGAAATYALKSDITSMYKHKGSVAAVGNLPASGNTAGDVYNVTASGMNYVWTGSEWDALGGLFSLETISNGDIDTVVAS